MEVKRRSILKAFTWRFLATLVTVCVSFVLTKSVHIALGIGAFDTVIKLFAYYYHERVWSRISWGKLH